MLHYSPDDVEIVENELICAIREQVFATWQVVTCPPDWVDRYRQFMTKKGVPFREELADEEVWFLIPRKYRPNLWNLNSMKARLKVPMAR